VERTGARYTREPGDLFADPGIQAVHILVPSGAHKPLCEAAIKAGKAVICEKTLSLNADDSLALVRLAEQRGTIFYTSYMKRFIPAIEETVRRLPALGRILSAQVRAYQYWGFMWDELTPDHFMTKSPEKGTSALKRLHGGGILTCGGSHMLDLINFLFGRPTRLFGSMRYPEKSDCEAVASVLMETPTCPVHLDTIAHNHRHAGFLRDGFDERVEINGELGRIEFYSANWDEVDIKGSLLLHYDAKRGVCEEVRYSPVSPFERAIAHYHKQIERGEQGTPLRRTGYDVDEAIAHIERSAQTHQAVTVDWRIKE
jgi:predicted dehydrogenase